MKPIITLILAAFLSACSSSAKWPARTKNPDIMIADTMSDTDKDKIYEAIWATNPNAKLLSIDLQPKGKAKVATTTQTTIPITSTKHYTVVKSGSSWKVK